MNRALVVFGGAIEPDDSGGWKSALRDHSGVVYPAFRTAAAAHLQDTDPHTWVIISGGSAPADQTLNKPSIASVVKKELAALGVDPACMLQEDRSVNTFQGLLFTFDLAETHGINMLTIVSNEWALPRIQAMVDLLQSQTPSWGSIQLRYVPAEEVLLRFAGDRWSEAISQARTSPEYAERVRMEQQGIEDLRNGSYKF